MADDLEDWLDMSRHRERHQNNNLDRAEFLLTFAQYYPYGPQYVIFGGFFQVRSIVPEIIGGPGYELELLDQYSEYIKRLIVKLERPVGRDLYLRWYGTLQDSKLNPEVYELAPDTKLGTFPGYQNVRLSHHELQRIIGSFQYSILEIFDPKTKSETILQRESVWKLALDSRGHGINRN
ncbi:MULTISPECIES: hypothetical protein [unclassified Cryobacterium]|uniref:hypothetical protein n=1 Tax=unclassified Cryobacterium TaxID=2649013 RepID=UPI0018E067F3|nr:MULTISPECIES: hypothetical protein [unclassified Cryobacterium]